MIAMVRVICFAFILCLVSLPAKAATFDKENFTITLPDTWVEVPPEVLSAYMEELKQQAPTAAVPVYDYAFQPDNKGWLTYPYVLVQISRSGKVPPEELQSINKIDMNSAEIKRQTQGYGSLLDNVTLGQLSYDDATHTAWLKSDIDVAGMGKILGLSGMHLTNNGTVSVHAYAKADEFEDRLPEFTKLISSVTIPEIHQYNNTSIDWKRVGKQILLGGMAGALVAAFAQLWLRVRRPKIPKQ